MLNAEDPWNVLQDELNLWSASGTPATLWWRDDDAVLPGAKLDRLMHITSATGLLLAVIPANAKQTLAPVVATAAHVRVAQHGYAHINHARRGQGRPQGRPQGLGAWELGLHRGEVAVLHDLDRGRVMLEDLFGSAFLPVLVPPWNRIDPALFGPLAERNYHAVSAFGARSVKNPVTGLSLVNAHCDPIRWKNGARFAGIDKTIMQLVHHLQARRHGHVDEQEPTGYLTHHIDLDDDGWEFSTRLANVVSEHPGARWVEPDAVFATRGDER